MNKSLKITLISLTVVGALVGAYFIFRKEEEEAPKPRVEVGELSQIRVKPDGTIQEFNKKTQKWETV